MANVTTLTSETILANMPAIAAALGIEETFVYAPGKAGEKPNVSTDVPLRAIAIAHPRLVGQAMRAAIEGKLGNVSRAGLKASLGRDATFDDVAEERADIVGNMLANGTWNRRGGGNGEGAEPSIVSYQWEVLFDERKAVSVEAQRKVKASCGDTVKSVFGDGEKLSFGRYLDAVATTLAKETGKERDVIRSKLDAKYRDAAVALRDARKAADEAVDVKADLTGMLDGIEL